MKCPESIRDEQGGFNLPENWKQDDCFVYRPIPKKMFSLMIAPAGYKKPPEIIKTYFISDGNSTKIGKAINISIRLKELQCGNPSRLVPIIIIDSDSERLFHKHFKKYKIRNEWFSLPENYAEIVKTICEKNNLKYKTVN
ncbi:MAG: GIY-YIG nuclease family protein [Pseudomonadota bacterium]